MLRRRDCPLSANSGHGVTLALSAFSLGMVNALLTAIDYLMSASASDVEPEFEIIFINSLGIMMRETLTILALLTALSAAGCANGGKAKIDTGAGYVRSPDPILFTPSAEPAPSRRVSHSRRPVQTPEEQDPGVQAPTDEPQNDPADSPDEPSQDR
jgi:hypothetical protein